MHLERLDISHFRNLGSVSIELGAGLNFFYGANGAGKTALLEAVHFLGSGRSFRSGQARSLIQKGAESLTVRAVARPEQGPASTLAVSRGQQGDTTIRINGARERRLSELARRVPLQVLLPDVADLVFGAPQLRRQWLDWGAFHVKPQYLDALRGYVRVLKQRNGALKQLQAGAQSAASLDAWTDQLLEAAASVTGIRTEYVEALSPVFKDTLARLAPGLCVRLSYRRGWNQGIELHKVLGEMRQREVKLGSTQAGPHRGDIDLLAGSQAHSSKAATELSRGQGKIVASALRIAQAKLLVELGQQKSLFLIDDVGAELDDEHNSRFFEVLADMGCQIMAASTRPPTGIADYFTALPSTVFHVKRGVVHRSPDG